MGAKRLSAIVFVIALGMTVSSLATAATMKWCTTWRSQFDDAGHGEDVYTSTSELDRPARYAHYQVVNLETNEVQEGILDGNGCTPYLPVHGLTDYKFRQATWLERTGNRKVFVEFEGAPWGPYFTWWNSYYTTGFLFEPFQGVHQFNPSMTPASANVVVAASAVMAKYSTLEYPSGMRTYVRTGSDCTDGRYYIAGTRNICIDTQYSLNGPQMDHSNYKFVMIHEFGHRQADSVAGTSGPADGSGTIKWQTSSSHPCNCEFFEDLPGYSAPGGCFQNRKYIGGAQREAWAHYYATAAFNDRDDTDCGFAYWRPAYESTLPLADDPDVDEDAPLTVDCDRNVKWMEKYCPGSDRGVVQDWLVFFYRLWAYGNYRYSVDEITDVWENTDPASSTIGQSWDELVDTLTDPLEYSPSKINQFESKGDAAGVNH